MQARSPDQRGLDARIRSGQRRWLVLCLVGALAIVPVVTWFAAALPGAAVEDRPVPLVVTGLALTLVGLAVEGVALVRAGRSGQFARGRRSPLWAVPPRERRRLQQQLSGRRAVLPEDVPVLRVLATAARDRRWLVLVLLGFAVMQVGQALQFGGAVRVLSAAAVSGVLVAAAALHGEARRAERFLARHPSPGSGAA